MNIFSQVPHPFIGPTVVAWLTRIFFNYFAKVFTHVNKKLFPSKSFAKDAISHCGDSIESKVVTAVDELKEPQPTRRMQKVQESQGVQWTNHRSRTTEETLHCHQ